MEKLDNYISITNLSENAKKEFVKKYFDKDNMIIDFNKVIEVDDPEDEDETTEKWGCSGNASYVTNSYEDDFNYNNEDRILSMNLSTFYFGMTDEIFPGIIDPILRTLSKDELLKDSTISDTFYATNRDFVGDVLYYEGKLIYKNLVPIDSNDEEQIEKYYDNYNGWASDETIQEMIHSGDIQDLTLDTFKIDVKLFMDIKKDRLEEFLKKFCTDFANIEKDEIYIKAQKYYELEQENTTIFKTLQKKYNQYKSEKSLVSIDYNKMYGIDDIGGISYEFKDYNMESIKQFTVKDINDKLCQLGFEYKITRSLGDLIGEFQDATDTNIAIDDLVYAYLEINESNRIVSWVFYKYDAIKMTDLEFSLAEAQDRQINYDKLDSTIKNSFKIRYNHKKLI